MNDDFESRLKTLMNEQVDDTLGARRPAPEFKEPRAARRHRMSPRWTVTLAAAAVVAVAVGATATATELVSDRHHTNPGLTQTPTLTTPDPTATPTAPTTSTPTAPSSPAATHHSTPPRTSHSAAAPTTHTVSLGGASISLPNGWVARDLQEYDGKGETEIFPGWCLTPASTPVKVDVAYACPIELKTVTSPYGELSPDTAGGNTGNPEYCGQQYGNRTTELESTKQLGGRSADWRHWDYDCAKGPTRHVEQYVVSTLSSWILFSENASGATETVMAQIAEHSTLPAQTAPLRLVDFGYVKSAKVSGGTVRVVIDRVVQASGGVVNKSSATYSYDVPASIWAGGNTPPKVGDLVALRTNGTEVVSVQIGYE